MFHSATIEVTTRGRGTYDITDELQRAVRGSGISRGLCTVFVHHTSASLIINENADADVRRDLDAFMARLVPDGDPLFIHTAEGPRRHAVARAHRADADLARHSRSPAGAATSARGRACISGSTAARRTSAVSRSRSWASRSETGDAQTEGASAANSTRAITTATTATSARA